MNSSVETFFFSDLKILHQLLPKCPAYIGEGAGRCDCSKTASESKGSHEAKAMEMQPLPMVHGTLQIESVSTELGPIIYILEEIREK